jgi:Metallo-beta-lactamase superfamily
MKRAVTSLAISLVLVSCATMRPPSQVLVGRAVQAVGGADALAGVQTVALRGTVREWEPEQSMTAGGEMRFACESAFESVTQVGSGATRIDRSRKFSYPAPRSFTYTEVVTPTAGYVAGIDTNGRTKQSLESNPPAHTMSGLRLAAAQRELRRGSAVLLLEMLRNPDRVTSVADVTAGGVAYPAVDYRAGDQTFTVMFDRATGLPARIRTLDYLILTHHHMDHAGGVRAYAAQGATLVVGKGNAEHFRRVLAAPFTRNPDLTARDLSRTPIVEVADRYVVTDGQREVHAYRIDNNPHADGLLIGYVPDAKLGLATDIWSPGAGPLPDKLNPALASLVAAVKKAGVTPTRFAGGHGGVGDYAPLAALEGK